MGCPSWPTAEKVLSGKPFINLSSIAAFVRYLFALNDVDARIRINKIRPDFMLYTQKVRGSNPRAPTILSLLSMALRHLRH